MNHHQALNFSGYPGGKLQTQNKEMAPNKTLSWSSIRSNGPEQISPLNYKVSNPSSSLIMSSLSHIQQDDVETTGSTVMYQKYKGASIPKTINTANEGHSRELGNQRHQDFYQYLTHASQCGQYEQINQQQKATQIKHSKQNYQIFYQQSPYVSQNQRAPHVFQNQRAPCVFQNKATNGNPSIWHKNDYTIASNSNKNFTLMNDHSGFSAQQSLIHLQHSQQQLSFIKFKLQQAYEKLEKEILNSYQLEQKIQCFKVEIKGKEELIQLEKNENQKLKFTLKAIMKNKSFLEDQMQRGQAKNITSHQTNRQIQLKENLKLKLQIKELTTKTKFYQDSLKSYQQKNQLLESQVSNLKDELVQSSKQCESLRQQISKKDEYLSNLLQQMHQIESLKEQKEMFLIKETQQLNQIKVIELELRKVTDEKVTSIARLKHELAMVQKHNEELLQQNEAIKHSQRYNMNESRLMSYSPVGLPPNQFMVYSPSPVSKKQISRSISKFPQNNFQQINSTSAQFTIFDSEDQTRRNPSQLAETYSHYNEQFSHQNSQKDSRNLSNRQNGNKKRAVKYDENKENLQGENVQQSFVDRLKDETPKTEGSVGKWKKSRSQSYNQSLQIEAPPKQQQTHQTSNHGHQKPKIDIKTLQNSDSIQKIISEKISTTISVQNQDEKLSKYQQHRKRIECELQNLQKIKRPTTQQRQKMQKLQKQLYYLDSDIAGLKRKIRRKY